MEPRTTKLWVQVEVSQDRPGADARLVGGIDPEAARRALRDLYMFQPEYAPHELFNDKNEMYTAPRRLWDVIREDYKKDPQELQRMMVERAMPRAERRATTERVAEWQADHPKEEAAVVEVHKVSPGRDAYLAVSKARIEKSVTNLLTAKSVGAERLEGTGIAEWVGCSAAELSDATMGDDDAPFFSEAFLYTLLGKEQARSVLARVNAIARALGVDPWRVRQDGPPTGDDVEEFSGDDKRPVPTTQTATVTQGNPLVVQVGGMELRVVESETQVALWLNRNSEGSFLLNKSWSKASE